MHHVSTQEAVSKETQSSQGSIMASNLLPLSTGGRTYLNAVAVKNADNSAVKCQLNP